MERLFSVADICERYQFKDRRTARKVMRDMDHLEKPLMVSERAVRAWEMKNTMPGRMVKERGRKR